jgi:hypothetical protein
MWGDASIVLAAASQVAPTTATPIPTPTPTPTSASFSSTVTAVAASAPPYLSPDSLDFTDHEGGDTRYNVGGQAARAGALGLGLDIETGNLVKVEGGPVGRKALDRAYEQVVQVSCTPRVQKLLVKLLAVLSAHSNGSISTGAGAGSAGGAGSGVGATMLTDRTFLVKAIKLLKAEAYLRGRDATVPADLHVLRFLTTFRLPPHIHEQITPIIQAVLDGVLMPPEELTNKDGKGDGNGGSDEDGAESGKVLFPL